MIIAIQQWNLLYSTSGTKHGYETEYGERQYGVVDFAGHHWLFSRHARDVNPADWGALPA